MKYIKYSVIVLLGFALLLGVTFSLKSSPSDAKDQYSRIRNAVAGYDMLSYDYNFSYHFADGLKQLNGTLTATKKMVLDENKELISFRTEGWIYKALHEEQQVVIADVNKLKKQAIPQKTVVQHDTVEVVKDSLYKIVASENKVGLTSFFIPDSTLFKHGTIQLSKDEKLTRLVVSFDQETMMDSLIIHFDELNQKVAYLKCQYLQPTTYNQRLDEDEYVKVVFTADNFKLNDTDFRTPDLNQYFVERGGKIRLKKYKNYQLIEVQ